MILKLICMISVVAGCVIISGCATTEEDIQTATDGTYQAIMDADAWIKKNMW